MANPPAPEGFVKDQAGEVPDSFDYECSPKKIRRYPVHLQHDEMDCAAASLASIAKYFGVDFGVSFFRNLIDVRADGASMYGISSAAERIGLMTRGVQLDLTELNRIRLPAITAIGYHFVVIYEVRREIVIIGDPAVGLRKISLKDFGKNWSGILLLFNTTPDFFTHHAPSSRMHLYLKF